METIEINNSFSHSYLNCRLYIYEIRNFGQAGKEIGKISSDFFKFCKSQKQLFISVSLKFYICSCIWRLALY